MVVTKYSLIGAILQYYPSAEQCFRNGDALCILPYVTARNIRTGMYDTSV